jgi:hypothetical protein
MDLVTVAAAVMTTGVATIATTTVTTTATTIGGDEFHSLGTNPHLTSACLPFRSKPSEGLGYRAGAFMRLPVLQEFWRISRMVYSG